MRAVVRPIATFLVLGVIGVVVAIAIWAAFQVLLLVTWPWRVRAQRIATSRAVIQHAIDTASAQRAALADVERHFNPIPTQRKASA